MPRNSSTGDHSAPGPVWRADHAAFNRPTADELFAALDGRPFTFFNNTWRLKIYSIYDQHDSRWLQVRMEGRPQHSTTLRVAVDASADDVIGVLTNWLIESRPIHQPTPYVH
jgi:hypothetical protein